jgi:hypothetical protein
MFQRSVLPLSSQHKIPRLESHFPIRLNLLSGSNANVISIVTNKET